MLYPAQALRSKYTLRDYARQARTQGGGVGGGSPPPPSSKIFLKKGYFSPFWEGSPPPLNLFSHIHPKILAALAVVFK